MEAEEGGKQKPDPYLRQLMIIIFVTTLFEGYDVIIINMALPLLGNEFAVGSDTLGFVLSLISIGTIAAFFSVRMADRLGRRRVFLWAAAGYSVFTLLSAFAVSLYDFTLYQFIARMLMVTEIGVGAIILTEELPARYRGMGIALMFSAATFGGILGAQLFPLVSDTHLGWRLLYLLGGGLLLILPFFWRYLRETRRWHDERQNTGVQTLPRQTLRNDVKTVCNRRYRRPLIAGSVIWFVTNFWTAIALFFFSYYVINERDWTTAQVGATLTVGFLVSLLGFAIAGPLLDLVGRKLTACLYFGIGGVAVMVCFLAQSPWLISAAYIVTLGVYPVWAVSATITSEVFPTAIRGTANAVVNNMIGRSGMVVAPALVGILATVLGSTGNAVALLAVVNFLALPVILWLLQETKGRTLEEITSP